jgi:hypothetical protein
MTKQFVAFPKIGQFRQVVKSVRDTSAYQGCDEAGEPIMDYSKKQPTVTFTGTVKLHGTNAGICYNPVTDELYAQSRARVLSIESDNAGFAFWVDANQEALRQMFDVYQTRTNDLITIFGEWCGGNIQGNVAITGLPKMFVIFAVKVGDNWTNNLEAGFSHNINLPVYLITKFPTYTMDIDFNNPDMSVPKLQELTLAVEAECPVGKALGNIGIGEGIVWRNANNNMFKVKGEKHTSSKVKKLASVDIEKLTSINEFVEYAVTESRLEQGIDVVFTQQSLEVDIKMLGDFLKWLMRDIISEETDTLAGNGLEPKDVGKGVSTKGREWFKAKYL